MDRDGFTAYMKKQRRSKGTIKNCVQFTSEFLSYLVQKREVMDLDQALPEDLETFVEWLKVKGKSPNSYLWGIGRYYEFSGNEEMQSFASRWRQRLIDKRRGKRKGLSLKRIMGVNLAHIEKLAEAGVTDTKTLLEAGKTKLERENLALESGVPEDDLLELIKLADLTRIVDIKAVRVRLLYDAGIETIKQLSQFQAQELRSRLSEVNQEKRILKHDPTLVETKYWIKQARDLPRAVNFHQ
jgi:predicted flap endonuclease-1-like 5' DNA nuclease